MEPKIFDKRQQPTPIIGTPAHMQAPAEVKRVKVCQSCGNECIMTDKFCRECGAKIVLRITENVMERWDEFLPHFPHWRGNETDMFIEELGPDSNGNMAYRFGVSHKGVSDVLEMVNRYRNTLRSHGFQMYLQPTFKDLDSRQLYKEINGVDYHCNTKGSSGKVPGYVTFDFDTEPPKNKRPSRL